MRQIDLAMVKQSPDHRSEAFEKNRQETPPAWAEIQEGLANEAGLSLLLVDGPQPPALLLSNNNSICRAIQSSAEHSARCDPFCGTAHSRALSAQSTTFYRCHAGLHCFAEPVQIGSRRDMAVIGGRAFLEIADYKDTVERLRTGDLKELFAEETFENVIFGTMGKLKTLAGHVALATRAQSAPRLQTPPSSNVVRIHVDKRLEAPDLQKEVERLRSQVEHQSRFARSMQYFLERISSTDPEQTYVAILTNSKDLLQAERASLLVYDEATKELTVKAAIGIPIDIAEVSSIRLGEGISGETLAAGRPVMVADLEAAGITPAPAERQYKTKSFISYPITIAGRRVGVLNVTDKSGGGSYNEVDLSLLEIVAPHVAMALESAEWQQKATQFQLMSITDPLTGLPNRRYLQERLAEEVNRSRRYEQPLSFLMIDIDDFKLYNDLNGHQAGDLALQMTAQELKGTLRSADVASRYGGEEFSVLLPQTSLQEAGVIAERMRERIEQTPFPHAKAQPLKAVTISIGVSTFTGSVSTAEQIIWAADRALYQAKSEGKNKIAFFEDRTLRVPETDEH
jgi:diguanylate cyclase (GGDEF)-like protein